MMMMTMIYDPVPTFLAQVVTANWQSSHDEGDDGGDDDDDDDDHDDHDNHYHDHDRDKDEEDL